ncbi:MAG TPA: hypothetical protein VFV72_14180 [Candidatus Limnocylindrales bacterium]|nr:hypothetical protein [Candidatus Limnocylindrales bacterium]
MTQQTQFDRVLPGLFDDLAGARIPDYLEAAIETASSRTQRPAWTYPGRWLPMQVTTAALPVARGQLRLVGMLALIGLLVAMAIAAYVGSRQAPRVTVPPFGPAGNGVIAVEKDGDIFVADRPGGDLRPLVVGPGDDRSPMFSSDGSRLAFVRADTADTGQGDLLMVADADGTNVVQLPPFGRVTSNSRWSFAPDGRSLMTVAQIGDGKRILIRPTDPAAAPAVLDIRLPASWMLVENPSFRPTNPQEILVVAQLRSDGPRGLYVYDLATGGIRTIVEPTEADELYVKDVAWLPDGEHITYSGRIVAADGSGSHALAALESDRISPVSNDGTRIVSDIPKTDIPGDDSHQRAVVVPINGRGESVELACGLGTPIECAWSWIWSPDDSMLIGTVPHEISSTYLQADPATGEVTELDWVVAEVGPQAWQRVAP